MNGHKPRPGRPSREPAEGERVGLSLRVTPRTKRALDAAAENNGKSLSQEAEARIDQTFRDERLLPQTLDLAYGPRNSGLLFLIGWLTKRVAEISSGPPNRGISAASPDWMTDPWARHQVAEAIRMVADELDPHPDDVAVPAGIAEWPTDHERRAIRGPHPFSGNRDLERDVDASRFSIGF